MGHLYDDRADGERLNKHFYFAGGRGGKVDAPGFGNVTQCGNVNFSKDENAGHRPKDYFQGGFGQIKKLRLADYGETNKGAADQNFVSQRVHHSAELTGNIELAGYFAVNNIGKAGNDKKDEGNIQKERPVYNTG